MARKPFVIALEEHYHDPAIVAAMGSAMEGRRKEEIRARLDDLGVLRLKEMDEAGVDFQVLSHGAPSTQRLSGESAVAMARDVNDRLHRVVIEHPRRFGAFAALPTAEPKAAAEELERTVTRLGFVGAMVHGLCNGVFFDDQRFWPIFERAEALDVPIYLHPAAPHPAVFEIYFKDYAAKHPQFPMAAWGFTVETATLAIRLVLSGVFDRHPNLKFILGHLGETVPFLSWRIDMTLARDGAHGRGFREKFFSHFYITTSGFFSNTALECCIKEIGIDRIMFSIDYPFVENPPGTRWALEQLTLSEQDKEKLLNGNARRILKLKGAS
ncbi:MAG TPA: amidohydrolase family protein [Stellaceae bacterium]|nr:amidohydrolase family protein [Stellaceae bacterium]